MDRFKPEGRTVGVIVMQSVGHGSLWHNGWWLTRASSYNIYQVPMASRAKKNLCKPTVGENSYVLLRTIIRFEELRNTLDSENHCYSTHLEAETAYFLHVSALSSNPPNAPIRLDHHTGIKVCHLPFLTSKRIRSWCDNPLKFARHFWRFR
jgi:hypothetical protein